MNLSIFVFCKEKEYCTQNKIIMSFQKILSFLFIVSFFMACNSDDNNDIIEGDYSDI